MPDPDLVNVGQSDPASGGVDPSAGFEHRYALAHATVEMAAATVAKVAANEIEKGDVLACARIAGIQAAKRAPELIPSALPVMVGAVILDFSLQETAVWISARVDAFDRLGVAIEALTCASVAALTIYDMCKAIDRSMTVTDAAIDEQGVNGVATWRRGPS